MSAAARLGSFRSALQKESLHAYIIPTEDAHQSEYISESDKRRAWISGFTGSAGTAVVTLKEAALWTDGRYFLQASKQLDSAHWKLMKSGLPETPSMENWLKQVLPPSSSVGIDPRLFSKASATRLENALKGAGHTLKALERNLIDEVWTDRPAPPSASVFIHPIQYAGQEFPQKLQAVREYLSRSKADALVISSLDEIAWLYNLRGSDISFNPVFISYAVVTGDKAFLFIDPRKISEDVRKHLGSHVELRGYEDVFPFLRSLSADGKRVSMDSTRCNLFLFNSVAAEHIVADGSPITLPKALKNPVEVEGLRQAHLRDGAALISFIAWLEAELEKGNTSLTECSVSDKLEEFRSKQKDFVSLSFETIAGSGPNGAIIHYKPEESSCAPVTKNHLFLLDSGGQYRDGTTDVTRTMHFGTPTAQEKAAFTRVLQGHIALDLAVFPRGTSGGKLDVLARMPLWKAGLDYRHGTGHGVGAFLNVHEGPQGISFREGALGVALQPGMTVTNEPGYYEDGAFGIRIESVLIVKEANTPHRFGDIPYYGFEHITFSPIQTKMIDLALMSEEDIKWVNDYNAECLHKVGPLLSGAPLDWLKKEAKPLTR
jgi:Xaa-Pro aminopeptidase